MFIWEFFTSDTAPWWSALLGTVIGGFITWLISRSSMKAQAGNEQVKAEAAREYDDRVRWRLEMSELIAELLSVHFQYMDRVVRYQYDLAMKFGGSDQFDFDKREVRDAIAETLERLAALNTDLRRLNARIQILSQGDLGVASQHLFDMSHKHNPGLPSAKFKANTTEAEESADLLMRVAKDALTVNGVETTGQWQLYKDEAASSSS